MDLLERIDRRLADTRARNDPHDFEDCATSMYPGLVPIVGGTDFGLDAEITSLESKPMVYTWLTDPTSKTASDVLEAHGSSCRPSRCTGWRIYRTSSGRGVRNRPVARTAAAGRSRPMRFSASPSR